MGQCADCGGKAHTIWGSFGYLCLCTECYTRRKQEQIIEKSHEVKSCTDFKTWDGGDLSELFWIHLGRYVKEPNLESLEYMDMAVRWARHSSHGLSNSFSNALKWAGIDLYAEQRRWNS